MPLLLSGTPQEVKKRTDTLCSAALYSRYGNRFINTHFLPRTHTYTTDSFSIWHGTGRTSTLARRTPGRSGFAFVHARIRLLPNCKLFPGPYWVSRSIAIDDGWIGDISALSRLIEPRDRRPPQPPRVPSPSGSPSLIIVLL